MSTYKEIKGESIISVGTDLSSPSNTGQIFYNNTSPGAFKSLVQSEAWSSSTPMITARSQVAGAGNKAAGLAMGGTPSSSSAPSRTHGNKVEEYSGLGWSTQATCPLYKRQGSAFGTQTAALFFGGYDDPQGYEATSAEYDGSSWTSGGSYPKDISNGSSSGGAGTQTAGFNAGGYTPDTYLNETFEYDGSSWTAGGALPWSAGNVDNLGTQTAGLAAGGNIPPVTSNVALYDGSSWTSTTSAPAPLQGNASAGIQTDAVVFGGPLPSAHSTATLKWDGTSWSTSSATLARGRNNGAGTAASPASTDAILAGGDVSETNVYGDTEEYNVSLNVITSAAWASGGALNTGRYFLAGTGSQTAGIAFGGYSGAPSGVTETYDGTSYTEVNDLGTARYTLGAAGTQTSTLGFGGGPGTKNETEEYNGTSWSEQNNLSTGRRSIGGTGTQTAGLAFGGFVTAASAATEEYDGTSWTNGGNLNTARRTSSGSGTQTAGLAIAGGSDGPSNTGATEEYNGTAWSESGDLITARRNGAASNGLGTQDSAILFGGCPGAPSAGTTATEGYDGTVWSTRPSLATARGYMAGFGSSTAAVATGNYPAATTTEEFTGETSSLNIKTLTTS